MNQSNSFVAYLHKDSIVSHLDSTGLFDFIFTCLVHTGQLRICVGFVYC